MKRFLFCVALSLPVLCVQPASGVPTLVCGACQRASAVTALQPEGGTSLYGLPAFPSMERDEFSIFSTPHKYVFRLAVCITPEDMATTFYGNDADATKWLKELVVKLNSVYERDLGIRLVLVEDPKLLMHQNNTGLSLHHYNGTKIINQLIGEDSYDVGILINSKAENGSNTSGDAPLGGVYRKETKANAWSITDWLTIAHEMGHLFGANHTHDKFGGLCVEPGKGQSMMGYGTPRNFFSFPSIWEIRNFLKRSNYYLTSKREPGQIGGGNPVEPNANLPYIEATTTPQIELEHRAIKKEYTVTNGTYFQFYVPAKNPTANTLYAAHPIDIVNSGSALQHSNACMPAYEAQKGNSVMFQRYYSKPTGHSQKQQNKVPFSDEFREGTFTFLLGAYDNGRYETERVVLHIVNGEQFRITKFTDVYYGEMKAGEKYSLQWTPCHAQFGKDSKVRILLSDDFGQTFKYVLADDYPNTGSWDGYLPYVEIGKVDYKDFGLKVKGAVIKVEVKGEAAYAVTHVEPYYISGKDAMPSGGFLIMKSKQYIRFTEEPTPVLEVENESQVPAAVQLQAYHKNSPDKLYDVTYKEERMGNTIRRTWMSPRIGKLEPVPYTQIITIRNSAALEASYVKAEAEKLGASVFDLLKNEGEVGYPQPTLAEYVAFRDAAKAVYNSKEEVVAEVSSEAVTKLRESLDALAKLKVNQLVLPATGESYRLRNYQHHFGKDYYYYVKQAADKTMRDGFTPNETEGTIWTCSMKNGEVTLTANGRTLYTQIFSNNGTEFTLDRGCTWGSFMLVNKQQEVAYLDAVGSYLGVHENHNPLAPRRSYRNSANSTEFQFTPVRGKEVGSLTIATAEGYGTVYTADAYVMPQGVTGYTVTGADNARGEVTLHEAYASGATVPAQTALVVRGGQRTYKLFAPQEGTAPVAAPTNYLQGAVTAETTKAPNGQPASDYYFYKLYYSKATGTPRLGFYWGAAEGAPFESAAGKAYLALPRTMAAATTGFALPLDPTTGLCTPVERPLGAQPQAVYTLSGVRLQVSSISQLPSGVYIVDGKKVVVK